MTVDYFMLGLLVLLVLVLILTARLVHLGKKIAVLSQTVESQSRDTESAQKGVTQLSEEIQEVRAASMGLGRYIKNVEQQIQQLQQQLQHTSRKQQELADRDPEARLYNKASKLVAEGATVEEIMSECELPRAEAELLMNLHKP